MGGKRFALFPTTQGSRMSTSRSLALLAFVLLLHGCAVAPSVLSSSQQQSLHETPLFGETGSPRFIAYLACVAEDHSCSTVNHTFAAWAEDRGVDLHLVEADDAVFKGAAAGAKAGTGQPFRLGFQINLLLVPSFFQFRGGMHAQGGYKPPRVGYTGTVFVYDASGKLLQALPVHQEVTAKPDDPANGYIQAEMKVLLSSVDPRYRNAGK